MAQLVEYLSKHEDQRSVNKSQNPTVIIAGETDMRLPGLAAHHSS